MSTLASHSSRPGRRPLQRANRPDDEPRCPYCGAPLTRKEFEESRARIEARIAQVEQNLKDTFAREQQRNASKATAEIAKAKKEAVAAAAMQIKAFRSTQEAKIAQRVQAAREAAEKKLTETIAAERTKAYDERMKLDAQLADLQRRLQRRTADELSQVETDLYAGLVNEFGGGENKIGMADKLARVARGRLGADILHDVVHNGAVVGRIIYDSKNHKRWQNTFTTKLRLDMVHHKADHAILSSSVFPAGARQLHIQDGVVVAAPERVLALAHLLRRQVVQVHALRLGNQGRDEKRDQVYDFITSDRCSQLLDRISSLSNDVLEIDAKEESTHRSVWKRRSELIRAIHTVHTEFTAQIEQIVGGTVMEPSP